MDQPWDLDAWRRHAREALQAGMPPETLAWAGPAQAGLAFDQRLDPASSPHAATRVASAFLPLAGAVLCHRDPHRHGLLYRLLWRMSHGEPRLLERASDQDVHRARELEKAVRRDSHKMKAFMRFREVPGEHEAYIAWFEPDHYILDRVAPFFARRFAGMRWAILTPYRSASWDGVQLAFGDGAERADAPAEDAQDALWRTYYASIFNPARVNPRMMRQEMPQKYWGLLPEARLIPGLIRDAGPRVRDMAERAHEPPRRRIPTPQRVEPAAGTHDSSLQQLKAAVAQCRRCPLWQPATQAVPGEGPEHARIMVVGEQPGDQEDLTGRPFVGPAGKLFDRTLQTLGIDRADLYITNAVKHFRFEQRGKVRLHRNPNVAHIDACAPWLEREVAMVRPEIIVCLGATAARAVFGRDFRLGEARGTWFTLASGVRAFATVHPAAVLRQSGPGGEAFLAAFQRDLALLRDIGGSARAGG